MSSFITTYFPIPFFAALFFGYKFWHKTKIIDYEKIDFVTGSSMKVSDEVRETFAAPSLATLIWYVCIAISTESLGEACR